MATSPLHPTPTASLLRYRVLSERLVHDDDGWEDAYWLRVAAHLAVTCPEPADPLAERIREVAAGLQTRAEWFSTLASPVRFALAAMLIVHRIDSGEFLDMHSHVADLMTEIGLRHGRFYEAATVVILMMSPGRDYANKVGIDRMTALYEQMKRCHWWLTGPHDLPACAALVDGLGTPQEIGAQVEDAYQALHRAGMPHGERLQTAANLLPLAGVAMDEAVDRYRRLFAAMTQHAGAVLPMHYEPLALLSLLDAQRSRDAGLVVERWLATTAELDEFQIPERGETNLVIAADLAFVDLAGVSNDAGAARPDLTAFHRGAVIITSHLDPLQAMYVGERGTSDWPLFWGRSPAARR